MTNGTMGLSVYGSDTYFPHMKQGIYVRYMNMTTEQGPQLTYFGDAKVVNEFHDNSDGVASVIQHFDGATTNVTVDSPYTDNGAVVTSIPSSSPAHVYVYGTKSTGTMGVQTAKLLGDELGNSGNDWIYYHCTGVSTPIHTSSHYQTFETPYLHEFVGGDRNMEQTNLIVTADGKTWDEVTRDTSYIGGVIFQADGSADTSSGWASVIPTEVRGFAQSAPMALVQKDVALAYDRVIILKSGNYFISYAGTTIAAGQYGQARLVVNGTAMIYVSDDPDSADRGNLSWQMSMILKRGDYIQWQGTNLEASGDYLHNLEIRRV